MEDFCNLTDPDKIVQAFKSCRDSLNHLLITGKARETNLKELEDIEIDDVRITASDVHEVVYEARLGQDLSYAPYSHFNVGAAIKTPSHTVIGCNVENSAYGSTICAERTAAFRAVAKGEREFNLVGIVGDFDFSMPPEARKASQQDYVFPCGCCRQVLNEFGGENLGFVLAKANDNIFITLSRYILPGAFGPEALGVNAEDYSRYPKPVST